MADWYFNSRDEQLHMMDTWLSVFQTRAAEWGIPSAQVTTLAADRDRAKAILAVVKSGDRTPASVVECGEAFTDMETEARFIKRHYLLSPPLSPADLTSLLLPLPDESQTPVPPPTGQPFLSASYPGGPHVLALRLGPLPGTDPLDARGDYGYALYRGVMPQGGATLEQAAGVKHYLMKAPLSGEELLHYRFTRRSRELVDFAAEEAGMTAWFCARYENGKGEAGKWGPVVQAVIP
jgi:hypothetical protein